MQMDQFTPLTEQESQEVNGGLTLNIGDLLVGNIENLNLGQLATQLSGALILTGATLAVTLDALGKRVKDILTSFGN